MHNLFGDPVDEGYDTSVGRCPECRFPLRLCTCGTLEEYDAWCRSLYREASDDDDK